MDPTDAELLSSCLAAIKKLLGGAQSAKWGDHEVTLSDLPDLRAARVELEQRINTAERQAAGDYAPARHQVSSFRCG